MLTGILIVLEVELYFDFLNKIWNLNFVNWKNVVDKRDFI